MITLTIGRRFKGEFQTVAEAQKAYTTMRDQSGEGRSEWPDGIVKAGNRRMRFSYNGRLWAGSKYVPGEESLDVATVDAEVSAS